jgi:FkbM family methyltransferase
MIGDVARVARRLAKSLIGKEKFHRAEVRRSRLRLGNPNAGFTIEPTLLTTDSVIYSFGIGTDISFDLECIERFSVHVHAFDPTPRSLKWIREQDVPSNLKAYAYGLSSADGTMTLHPPADPTHVSYSIVERPGEKALCPVYKLSTIMQMLGHEHIDLLKMDIEGCEYDVIGNLSAERIRIPQICVEFHHRWPEIGNRKTDVAIEQLRSIGYRLFDVSPSGEEFSFVHLG